LAPRAQERDGTPSRFRGLHADGAVTLATERWEFPATDGVTENALGSASGSSRVNERKVFTGELLR
jgi:hypothetical protein